MCGYFIIDKQNQDKMKEKTTTSGNSYSRKKFPITRRVILLYLSLISANIYEESKYYNMDWKLILTLFNEHIITSIIQISKLMNQSKILWKNIQNNYTYTPVNKNLYFPTYLASKSSHTTSASLWFKSRIITNYYWITYMIYRNNSYAIHVLKMKASYMA